jgi:hypothetical protein
MPAEAYVERRKMQGKRPEERWENSNDWVVVGFNPQVARRVSETNDIVYWK